MKATRLTAEAQAKRRKKKRSGH